MNQTEQNRTCDGFLHSLRSGNYKMATAFASDGARMEQRGNAVARYASLHSMVVQRLETLATDGEWAKVYEAMVCFEKLLTPSQIHDLSFGLVSGEIEKLTRLINEMLATNVP